MKFFLPEFENEPENAEKTWRAMKTSVESQFGPLTERRIFRIRYRHDGEYGVAEVAKIDHEQREPIIAIFEGDPYCVCTPNRGVLHGVPILVGKDEAIEVTFFDECLPGTEPDAGG